MDSSSRKIRHVIIGAGAGVFSMHRPAYDLPTTELVAVCDIDVEAGERVADDMGVPFYADYHAMLADKQPDVAVVMTPHPLHAPIAIDCLAAGCHVLVEKPMADEVGRADAMVEAAERAGKLLAVNFQQRTRYEVQAARRLIQEGRLGKIQHVDMIETWLRTAAYYQQRPWRGTWTGEGGGVLLNQSPHTVDLVCYLVGMPARLSGWTRTQLHQIETEDSAGALLEWADGATGTIHVSTAETGLPQRMDIIGTKGILRLRHGELSFEEFETDVREFLPSAPGPFSAPASQPVEVPFEASGGTHPDIYRDLHSAILDGTPLVAPGSEGRMQIEVANAMTYSSYAGQPVEFPLDRVAYADLLAKLREETQQQ